MNPLITVEHVYVAKQCMLLQYSLPFPRPSEESDSNVDLRWTGTRSEVVYVAAIQSPIPTDLL